jgi:hypothetical protein
VDEPAGRPDPRPVADLAVLADSLAARPADPTTPSLAPGQVSMREEFPKISPVSPQRFAIQTTINQATHDKLRRAQELLGSAIPAGDLAQVLDRALDALIRQLEKRKYAATGKPPRSPRPSDASSHIPAHVRRAVGERDAGRCTFVSDTGHRCEARKFLEFDHIEPIARGGRSTIANVRLRCRAHNQYEAERAFGAELMSRKRENAQQARAEIRERVAAEAARVEAAQVEAARAEAARVEAARTESAEKARAAAEQVRAEAEAQAAAERARDPVVSCLRRLGFRADEARRAATLVATNGDAPLEERVRLALRHLAPPGTRRVASFAPAPA